MKKKTFGFILHIKASPGVLASFLLSPEEMRLCYTQQGSALLLTLCSGACHSAEGAPQEGTRFQTHAQPAGCPSDPSKMPLRDH